MATAEVKSPDGAPQPGLGSGGRAPKRPHPGAGLKQPWKPKKTKREKNIKEGSSEEVLKHDILALLESRRSGAHEDGGEPAAPEALPEEGTETEVEVLELSSTGDGLAMRPGSDQVYVVPFVVPGDRARVKVFRHVPAEHRTAADFVSVARPAPQRDDARVRCKYFASCGGCQFQMLDYPEQLRLKRRVLDKAYANFANLPAAAVPAVRDTVGSPLQYGYRTKLTPHFDGPPGFRPSKRKQDPNLRFEACPDIGFMVKGQRRVRDIEDCPIGTDAVRLGMGRERERMKREFGNYKRGATILLRENTKRYRKDGDEQPPADDALPPYTARTETDAAVDVKSCETDHKATTTEYIGDYVFTNPAGSFFQNNNAILPTFTAYIRDHILPPGNPHGIRFLIDAYSGSGLFTITLSPLFQRSIGIDIAADSIACARRNAALNGLSSDPSSSSSDSSGDRCTFVAADANALFDSVSSYDPSQTAVVLDPPRKGCDAAFLAQLRRFAPRRVVYVSCNVHTQARDVGVLVRGEGAGARYAIESLTGFDFFPQTAHVEGVAVLNRVDDDAEAGSAD